MDIIKTIKLPAASKRVTQSKTIYAVKSKMTLQKLFKNHQIKQHNKTAELRAVLKKNNIDYEPLFFEVIDGHVIDEAPGSNDVIACFSHDTAFIYRCDLFVVQLHQIVKPFNTAVNSPLLTDSLYVTLIRTEKAYILADAELYKDYSLKELKALTKTIQISIKKGSLDPIEGIKIVSATDASNEYIQVAAWESKKFVKTLSNYNYKGAK